MKIKYCWNCGREVPYQTYGEIDYVPKCDSCGVSYPEKPKDEALLTIYQDEYLNDRTDANFSKLFVLLKKVTFNVICHKLKSKSSYKQLDELQDDVQWTLEKLVQYYKEKPDFKITTSFVQYISQLVLYPLYNKIEQERKYKTISIHTPKFGNDDKCKELFDYLSQDDDGGINDLQNNLDYDKNKNDLVSKSLSFIGDVARSIYEYRDFEGKNLRNCIYVLLLYKFFISGQSNDLVVKKIMESMDYRLVKKFEESKNMYRDILLNYSNEN